MHPKPDLRVLLKWMIIRSGSVITDVIRLQKNSLCCDVELKSIQITDIAGDRRSVAISTAFDKRILSGLR